MTSHWYIAYTSSRFEKKINSQLSSLNISSYLPLHTVLRQWSDRKQKVEMPLFPNYIFVNITERDKYTVLNIPGVRRFITFEGKPATVSETIISTIRKVLHHAPDVTEELMVEKGERVKVVYGPFSGMEGVVVDRKGKKRLAIMLEEIEKVISIDINPSYIEKLA